MSDEPRIFVKICGVTTVDDALLAAGMGADALGLNFVASSSRRITSGRAKEITRRLPPEVLTVGIFRNESRERVVETANTIGLRAVQLHGHESAEDTRWVAERVPAVIRAFSANDPALARHVEFGPVRLLVDAPEPGSGHTFDWTRMDELELDCPVVLAGGLNPDNVTEAIETVRPWGVDAASGVESSPGKKDPVLVRRFIAAARAVPFSDHPYRAEPFDWAEDAARPDQTSQEDPR